MPTPDELVSQCMVQKMGPCKGGFEVQTTVPPLLMEAMVDFAEAMLGGAENYSETLVRRIDEGRKDGPGFEQAISPKLVVATSQDELGPGLVNAGPPVRHVASDDPHEILVDGRLAQPVRGDGRHFRLRELGRRTPVAELVHLGHGYPLRDALEAALAHWPRNGTRCHGTDEMAWHERATSTAWQFSTNHRGLVEWLREHFGHGAAEKRIPGWLLGASLSLRQAFLDGYLAGDGCSYGTSGTDIQECTTVSKALAFGIKALAASFGHSPQVHLNSRPNCIIDGRKVNSKPSYSVRWRPNICKNHQQTERQDGIEWAQVKHYDFIPDSTTTLYNIAVEEDESYVVESIIVHNCTHHSKASGGAPRSKRVRDLPWVVVHWAWQVQPRIIALENVEEIRQWGPLLVELAGKVCCPECYGHFPDLNAHRPCPACVGKTWSKWVAELHAAGYVVEWRELRACDYGSPTIRKRLYLIARRDGRPIVWPEPTHGPGRLPYRTAAECIDWAIPCPSIFERARPLAEATCRRIARGIFRYVLNAARPFLVPYYSSDLPRCNSVDEPIRTITTEPRFGVVSPVIAGCGGRAGQSRERSGDEPFHTVTTKADACIIAPHLMVNQANNIGREMSDPCTTITTGGHHALVGGCLAPRYGERPTQEPRCHDIEAPLPTITPDNNSGRLVAAWLAQHNLGNVGRPADEPLSTVVATGLQQQLVSSHLMVQRRNQDGQGVDEPLRTLCSGANHFAEVRAFLVKYYGTATGQQLAEPLDTVTTRDRFGLVTVDGQDYALVDIGMRMLSARELFSCQGFPADYVIEAPYKGGTLTKTAQIRCCGNSVCPQVAEAIVRANYVPDQPPVVRKRTRAVSSQGVMAL